MKKGNPSILRNETVRARVSNAEHQIIQHNAQLSGLSESEYIRRCLINKPIHAHDPAAIKVFCQIQTLLNKEILHHDESNISAIQEEMNQLCRFLR